MQQICRHKVFVSYHHEKDQNYRDRFERLFADVSNIMDSRSVRLGDIPKGLNTDEVARQMVLIGRDTWRRKHVDWEIAATVRDTEFNPRSGVLGIFLPTHPSYGPNTYDPYIIPPRLHYNVECDFAALYDWNESPNIVAGWIDAAFRRRNEVIPDNSLVRFGRNRKGERWQP